jgi:hypothetical protein
MTKEASNTLIKDLMGELVRMRQIIHNIENREFIQGTTMPTPIDGLDYSLKISENNQYFLTESYDRDVTGRFENLMKQYEKQISR